jgi:hypothetical protein
MNTVRDAVANKLAVAWRSKAIATATAPAKGGPGLSMAHSPTADPFA